MIPGLNQKNQKNPGSSENLIQAQSSNSNDNKNNANDSSYRTNPNPNFSNPNPNSSNPNPNSSSDPQKDKGASINSSLPPVYAAGLDDEEKPYTTHLKDSGYLIWQSLQSITTYLGLGVLNLSQMMIVKHTNSVHYIASFGLGLTWLNACSYALMIAVNDGMRTVSSQIYGARKYKLLGLVYNQSLAISLTICLLSLGLVLNSAKCLKALGIQPGIADGTQEFVMWSIPSLLATVQYEASRQYLYAQKIFQVSLYSQALSSALHPLWCYLFIVHWEMGLVGCGLARDVTYILGSLLVMAQMRYQREKLQLEKSYVPFSFYYAFRGWWPLLKVAVPAGGTQYLKWCSTEILTLQVGNLHHTAALAGHTTFFSANLFFSMFVKGLQTTANAAVGNAVGMQKLHRIRNLIVQSCLSCIMLSIFVMIVGKALQDFLVQQLCTTGAMEHYFIEIYNMYLLVDLWGNFMQQVLNGVLSALNQQNYAISFFIINFMVISVVVTYICGFVLQWGIVGCWMGRIVAGILNTVCQIFVLKGVDLQKEIDFVQDKLKKSISMQLPKELQELEDQNNNVNENSNQ